MLGIRSIIISVILPIVSVSPVVSCATSMESSWNEQLEHAVLKREFGLAEEALGNGADPNLTVNEDGSSLLMAAVVFHDSKMIDLLLANGADPNRLGKHGISPLHVAVKHENFDDALVLIDGGARLIEPPSETGLSRHIEMLTSSDDRSDNRYKVLQFLIKNGSEFDVSPRVGTTSAFGMAIFESDDQAVEIFTCASEAPRVAGTMVRYAVEELEGGKRRLRAKVPTKGGFKEKEWIFNCTGK